MGARAAGSPAAAPTVALIDSSSDRRHLFTYALQAQSIRIERMTPGANLENQLSDLDPQLIILSLEGSVDDMLTLCRQLRASERTRHLPIVAVSASNSPDERRRAVQAGAAECVSKYTPPSALTTEVWRVIRANARLSDRYALVVTQEPELRGFLESVFQRGLELGARATETGDDAWRALRQGVVDLLLVDMRADAPEAIFALFEKIKQDPNARFIPILALARIDKGPAFARILEAGANDVVRLPVIADELEARLKAHLRVKRLFDEVASLSITDDLTSIYNRRYLLTRFQEEMRRASRKRRPIACALIDIDGFGQFNSQHGRASGDQALTEVARVINATVRIEDIVGRYGGDEFLVVLPEGDGEEATQCAERVADAVAATAVHLEGQTRNLSVSIGVAVCEMPWARDVTDLIRAAERAQTRARHMGAERVAFTTVEKGLETRM